MATRLPSFSRRAALAGEAVDRTLEAKVFAQGLALVLEAEQAAALELRHDQLHEVVEPGRHDRRHHVEAVRGFVLEPALQLVGDLLWRADDLPVAARAGDPQIQV